MSVKTGNVWKLNYISEIHISVV